MQELKAYLVIFVAFVAFLLAVYIQGGGGHGAVPTIYANRFPLEVPRSECREVVTVVRGIGALLSAGLAGLRVKSRSLAQPPCHGCIRAGSGEAASRGDCLFRRLQLAL
jgi:hypothetical protein